MADKTSEYGAPSVPILMHDDGSGTYSPVISLSADTVTALAAAIVAAMEPE